MGRSDQRCPTTAPGARLRTAATTEWQAVTSPLLGAIGSAEWHRIVLLAAHEVGPYVSGA